MKPSEVAAMRVLAWCQKNGCIFTDSVRASLARELDRFAGEAVREERERCAKVADRFYLNATRENPDLNDPVKMAGRSATTDTAAQIAADIRGGS